MPRRPLQVMEELNALQRSIRERPSAGEIGGMMDDIAETFRKYATALLLHCPYLPLLALLLLLLMLLMLLMMLILVLLVLVLIYEHAAVVVDYSYAHVHVHGHAV